MKATKDWSEIVFSIFALSILIPAWIIGAILYLPSLGHSENWYNWLLEKIKSLEPDSMGQ